MTLTSGSDSITDTGIDRIGPPEDGEHGVGPALGRGAGEVLDPRIVAVHGLGLGPVGLELGVFDPGQDLLEDGALERTPAALEPEPGIELLDQTGPAGVVAAIGPVAGAVLVGQALPLPEQAGERLVRPHAGLFGEEVRRSTR